MRIGITCYPTYGGSGVLASELGKFLAQRGHIVHFITSSIPYRLQGEYQERLVFHTVDLEPYPLFDHPPYDLALAAKMKEVFVSEKLDVLHVHYAIPHAICAHLASEMLAPAGIPFVTTLHGTDITLVGRDRSLFDITRFSIERSTVVTAVSDWLKNETLATFNPTRAVERVHNFVDFKIFQPGLSPCRRDSLLRPGQVLYTHISNFRPVKRVQDVIKVFAKTRESVDAVLALVGEGPTLTEAKQLAESLGVQKHVRYLGKQMDVAAILACSDVLIFPSDHESFGLAPLEAMGCQVPVIASRSGGLTEVVEHGVCGFLEPVGDVDGMAKHAIALGQDAEMRREMGRKGRLRGLELFSPEIIVPQYEALYRKAMSAR
jgi:L-malate glycosyltransferase